MNKLRYSEEQMLEYQKTICLEVQHANQISIDRLVAEKNRTLEALNDFDSNQYLCRICRFVHLLELSRDEMNRANLD